MKRFTTLTFLMVTFMLISTAQAAYTANLFPVCEATGNQSLPDIDGDWIVWQDERAGSTYRHIYGYTLAEPNEVPICTDTDIVIVPAVSGHTVVWEDRRNSQRDIYAFDLLTRLSLTLTNLPLADGVYQQNPDISGDRIVYQHKPGSYYNIYVYDRTLTSAEAVSAVSANQYYPAIDGSIVAWMEQVAGVWQIFARDLDTNDPALQISSGSTGQQFPAVSGNIIVWEEPGSGSVTITAYDFSILSMVWTHTVSAANAYPQVSEGIIVWQELRSGGSDYDIRGYEISTEAYLDISTGMKDDQRPAISGKTVVWQRTNTNLDIHAAELLVPSTVTVTAPNGGGVYLAGSEIDITWTHTGPVDEVLIEFSSDGKTSWTPVAMVANTGSHTWNSFEDVDSVDCWISVTNPADGETDENNTAFTVYQIPDSITVTDPNGGEQFLAGSEMDIYWTTVGDVNDVKIEFSDNDGVDWQIVTPTTKNDGAFTWDAVPADANSTQCVIHISDVADSSTWDVSDAPLTVFQCDVELAADLTGDCFVDIADLAEMAGQWLLCGNPYDENWCFE